MTDRISQRRDSMNSLFVAANSLLIAIMGILVKEGFIEISVVIFCLAIVICCFWVILIFYYKRMNKIKFSIINKMEEHLSCNCSKYELDLLTSKKCHMPFSVIEMMLAATFIVGYIILGILALIYIY